MQIQGVIITGAAGFLGSHLAEFYLNQGLPVVGVDNFATGSRANIDYVNALPAANSFRFFEADVTEPWDRWAGKIPHEFAGRLTHVLHFASPASPPHYQRLGIETMWVNSLGLSRSLSWADANKAKVVFASTSEVYGDPEVNPQPESYRGSVNTVGIRSCYDESKRFGESLIYTHNLRHNTRHGIVRIFNTYGPRMNPEDGRVIINFLVQAQKGQALTVYGDGKQTRSFCYVDDLVAAINTYAEREIVEPVNIGNDIEFTILELADHVLNMFPEKNLSLKHEELPKDDPKLRRPDLTLAREVLAPWSPKVELKEGLERMAEWLAGVPGTSSL